MVLDLLAAGCCGYLLSVVDRAVPVEVQPGLIVPIARAEDIIVLKKLAGRDKDRKDIDVLYDTLGATLDHHYILRVLSQLKRKR